MQRLFAVMLFIAFVSQGTMVLAGTTGSLSGTLVDGATKKPLSGARVFVASPSQSASATSDAAGRFQFLALGPDTYTVSVSVAGYSPISVSGINVVADNVAIVSLVGVSAAKVIGTVTSRASSSLVSSGVTADVYSLNATVQDKASALGGGGTLNSAWSAISSVPGVFIAPNQGGYIGAGATVSIRGGDYDQIGYELDGIPVNRAFDNYPSGPLSSLGQQEVQVYTGAVPAAAEAQGISGYINQVIKTGTRPGTANLTAATGAPSFYHKLSFEIGGATPDRLFSYYIGVGGYNQDYRYADQFQGASLSREYGQPLAPCPGIAPGVNASTVPSCFSASGADYTNGGTTPAYALGPYNTFFAQGVQDRDSIINVHLGIPRKNGTHDDIQLLYDNNFINTPFYISTNDQGGAAYANLIGLGVPSYQDGYQFTGAPVGSVLPVSYAGGGASRYLFPSSPGNRAINGPIDPNLRDNFVNNQGIFKAQYTHAFGDNALLKVYGYTYYSDWLQNGPQSNYANYVGDVPGDYELESHTRGASVNFTDQLNPANLLTIQGSYTTSTSLRDNNTTYADGGGFGTRGGAGILVNGSNPYNGVCYSRAGATVNCFNASGSNLNSGVGNFTYAQAFNGTVTPAAGTCGTGPCQYLVIGDGQYATYNTVKPKFYSASITDQFRPNDKLNINIGLHVDRFEFDGSNTATSRARQFLFTAYDLQFPTAQQFNVPSQIEGYTEFQPRLGATFTLNPSTVLRASYGRYAQAPNSAFEQYNYLQSNSPSSLRGFVNFGIGNTPAHAIRPALSNNYDFSFEKQFPGQLAIKLTPFYRQTQDQIQQFYLDQKTGFVSGLNVGNQTSEGFEFELDKGDFSRNGVAAKLSFAYTNSYIRYNREPNGASVVDGINNEILSYNGYTSACASAPTSKNCVGAVAAVQAVGGSGVASACYTTAGAATACAPGTIANPYWNASPQALLDPAGKYPTFDTFPGPIGVGYTTYGAPYVATFLVQYKHGPLAITPAVQFSAGQRYGVPATTPGVLPDTCGAVLGSAVTGDPRYPGGAPGGSPYDGSSCNASAVIPNTATGVFDTLGAFVAPSSLQLSTQISYDVGKKLTLVSTLSNLVYSCFGGSKVPFAVAGACGYSTTYGAGSGPQPIGNTYNPGNAIQPLLKNSYAPFFKGFPFNAYFEARIKV